MEGWINLQTIITADQEAVRIYIKFQHIWHSNL